MNARTKQFAAKRTNQLFTSERLISMARKICFMVFLVSVVLTRYAKAQYVTDTDLATDPTYQSSEGGTVSLGSSGAYLHLNKMIGDSFGNQDGYLSMGMFAPVFQFDSGSLLFTDGRVMVSDHRLIGANIQGGMRVMFPGINALLGGYVGYDYDQARTGNEYQQVAFGIEWLSGLIDVRANGYVPTGTDMTTLGIIAYGTSATFDDNGQPVYVDTLLTEEAISGCDFEVGIPIPRVPWFKPHFGMYAYQTRDGEDPVGVKGRFRAEITDDTAFEVAITDDRSFGTNVTMNIEFTFDGSPGTQFFPEKSLDQRLYGLLARNYRIRTNSYTEAVYRPVTSGGPGGGGGPGTGGPGTGGPGTGGPGTGGTPIRIVYVDDSYDGSNGTPDGSRNRPFQYIEGSVAADYIVVRQGNTSAGSPLESNFVLLDGQQLIGEGVPHVVFGTVLTFPGFDTSSGVTPFITSADGGDVIELADGNLVSGFDIIAPSGSAAISGSGISDFEINRTDITGDGSGIVLTNASGTGLIDQLTVNVAPTASPGGISVYNTNTPDLDLTISNVPQLDGGAYGLSLAAANSKINADVSDVNATGNGTGVRLQATSAGDIVAELTNVIVSNTTGTGSSGDGFQNLAVGTGSTIDLTMVDSTATGAAGDGFSVELGSGAMMTGDVTNGLFTQSVGHGISINANNSSNNTLVFNGNGSLADDNGIDGMNILLRNNAQFAVTVHDGSFNNNIDDAYDVDLDGSSILSLNIDPTPAAGSGDNGLEFSVTNNSVFSAIFADSGLTGSGGDGINGVLGSSSSAVLNFTNSDITGSGTNGINVAATGGSTFTGNFSNASLDGNGVATGGDAAHFDLSNSTANLVFNTISADGSGGDGLYVSALAGSVFNGTFTGSSFTDSGQSLGADRNGMNLNSSASQIVVAATNTNIDNTGVGTTQENGLLFDAVSGGKLTATFSGLDMSNNQVNAVQGTVDGAGSVATVTLNNVTADNSGADGVNVATSTFGQFNLISSAASTIGNSGGHGITLDSTGSSLANFSLTDTTINGSADHGIDINASGLAQVTGATSNATITNNGQNLGADRNGIDVATTTGANVSLTLNNSTISNTGVNTSQLDGLHFDATLQGTFSVTATGTDLSGNTDNAIDATLANTNTQGTITLDGVNANNSGAAGVLFDVSGNAVLNVNSLNSTTISSSGSAGIDGTLSSGGTANFNFADTSVDSSQLDGLKVDAITGGVFNGTFADGSFNDNGQGALAGSDNGVSIDLDNATADLTMSNMAIGNVTGTTQQDGLLLNVVNGGTFTSNIGTSTLSNNTSNAVEVNATDAGSTATMVFDGVSANGSGEDGVVLNASNEAEVTVDFNNTNGTGNSISNSGGSGLVVLATGNGVAGDTTIDVTLNNTAVNNNGIDTLQPGNGIDLDAVNGGEVAVTMNNGTVEGNREDGVEVNLSDPLSSVSFNETGTSIANNVGAGLNVNLSNGTVYDSTFVGGSFSNNGTGLQVVATGDDGFGNPTTANLTFDGTLVQDNTNIGLDFLVEQGASMLIDISNGTNISNNGETGLKVVATDAATVLGLQMAGANIIDSNGTLTNGDGVDIDITNIAEYSLAIAGQVTNSGNNGIDVNISDVNTASNSLSINATVDNNGQYPGSQADGINLNLDNTTLEDLAIISSSANNNTRNGLSLAMIDSTVVHGSINNSAFNNNSGGHGVLLQMVNSDAPDFTISDNSGMSNNSGDGIQFSLTNSPLTGLTIQNNLNINSNTSNGINFVLTDSKLTDVVISDNQIGDAATAGSGNGQHGVVFNMAESPVSGTFTGNSVALNGGHGLFFDNPYSSSPMTLDFGDIPNGRTISGNEFTGNSGAGVFVNLVTTNSVSNVRFLGEVYDNTFANNNIGFRLEANRDATFDVEFGDKSVTTPRNTFTANSDAGIGIDISDDVVGDLQIGDAVITGTTDGGLADYSGEGIMIRMDQKALLQTATIDNNSAEISGNAGSGIGLFIVEESQVPDLQILNVQLLNNGGHGIGIHREDRSELGATIEDNIVTGNTLDGFNLFATNRKDTTLDFTFNDNVFEQNRDGLAFVTEADVVVMIDGDRNSLSNNVQHGLSISTGENSAIGDPVAFTPSNLRNTTIDGNGGDGVNIFADNSTRVILTLDSPVDPLATGRTSLSNNTNGVVLRTAVNDPNGASLFEGGGVSLTITGADIDNNIIDGVNVVTTGFSTTFDSATVVLGGSGAGEDVSLSRNGQDGIDITTNGGSLPGRDSSASPGLGTEGSLLLDSAIVSYNGADGITITNNGNSRFSSVVQNATEIRFNGERGVDILLTGAVGERVNNGGTTTTGTSFSFINSNVISDNAEEGLYFETNSGIYQDARIYLDNAGATSPTPTYGVTNNLQAPYNPVEGGGEPGYGDASFINPHGATLAHRSQAFNMEIIGTTTRYDGARVLDGGLPWNNLYTDIAATLTMTGNDIRDNGRGTDSHGVFLNIGTNSYVAADIQGNTFGGNVLSDFHTESFVTTDANGNALQPSAHVDNSGDTTSDIVYLDDTAQLDLLFAGNIGDKISPFANSSGGIGAKYAFDAAKGNQINQNNGNNGLGGDRLGDASARVLGSGRRGDIFLINLGDEGSSPNVFTQFGVAQDIRGAFSTGLYMSPTYNGAYGTIYGVSPFNDPLYPNFDFPGESNPSP